jgi:hypothetical protein
MGFRVRPLLGDRHVPGRTDEGAELPVGDRRPIHPEAVDRDTVARRLRKIGDRKNA